MEGKHKNRAPAIAGVLLSSAARSKSVRRMSVFGSAQISRPAPKRARKTARASGIGGSIARPTARTRSAADSRLCRLPSADGTRRGASLVPQNRIHPTGVAYRPFVSTPSVVPARQARRVPAVRPYRCKSKAKRVKEKPVHGANTKIKGRRHGAISLKFHINRICAFWRLQISSSASRWAFRSVLFCEALLRLRSERTGA